MLARLLGVSLTSLHQILGRTVVPGQVHSYPWAVNILDLRTLIDAWDYFGWGADQLIRYLDLRVALHNKIFATDELEIAGFFVKHGGLEPLVDADADRIQLDPSYSDVFDNIYRVRHGGEEVVYTPTEPFMEDLSQVLRDDR